MSIKRSFSVGLCTVLISLLGVAVARPAMADSFYSLDVYDPLLRVIDPADGSTIGAHWITVDSDTVQGGNGLTVSPSDGTMYALLKVESWEQRTLVTVDPETGIATVIANLTYPFASLTFDDSGTLYGVTGTAQWITASSRNALFEIDPSDGTLSQKCKFSAANQGHALAFGGGLIYHVSQSGTDYYGDVILETVDPADFPADSADACPTSNVDVSYGTGGIPAHPQSLLVTYAGVSGVNLMLSGWHNYDNCCDPELYEIVVTGSSGTATLLGLPDHNSKGLDFHTFDPDVATFDANLVITKLAAKLKAGAETQVIYTIQVTNAGASAVSDIALFDYFDTSKLAYVSDDGSCSVSFFTISCDLGTIAASASKTITIDTRVICKGKNCRSVNNAAEVRVPPLEGWVEDPYNNGASWWAYNTISLKGK